LKIVPKYREAFEEVALPLHCPDIHTIGLLEPVFSTSMFTVTPVIAILTNPSILDNLKPAEREVAKIFDHPLRAILDPELASNEALVSKGSDDWPYDTEYHVSYHPLVAHPRSHHVLSFHRE
jgi:coenzyme A diphosphatase NUDT7